MGTCYIFGFYPGIWHSRMCTSGSLGSCFQPSHLHRTLQGAYLQDCSNPAYLSIGLWMCYHVRLASSSVPESNGHWWNWYLPVRMWVCEEPWRVDSPLNLDLSAVVGSQFWFIYLCVWFFSFFPPFPLPSSVKGKLCAWRKNTATCMHTHTLAYTHARARAHTRILEIAKGTS